MNCWFEIKRKVDCVWKLFARNCNQLVFIYKNILPQNSTTDQSESRILEKHVKYKGYSRSAWY